MAFVNLDKLKSFAADVMDNVSEIVAPEGMSDEEDDEEDEEEEVRERMRRRGGGGSGRGVEQGEKAGGSKADAPAAAANAAAAAAAAGGGGIAALRARLAEERRKRAEAAAEGTSAPENGENKSDVRASVRPDVRATTEDKSGVAIAARAAPRKRDDGERAAAAAAAQQTPQETPAGTTSATAAAASASAAVEECINLRRELRRERSTRTDLERALQKAERARASAEEVVQEQERELAEVRARCDRAEMDATHEREKASRAIRDGSVLEKEKEKEREGERASIRAKEAALMRQVRDAEARRDKAEKEKADADEKLEVLRRHVAEEADREEQAEGLEVAALRRRVAELETNAAAAGDEARAAAETEATRAAEREAECVAMRTKVKELEEELTRAKGNEEAEVANLHAVIGQLTADSERAAMHAAESAARACEVEQLQRRVDEGYLRERALRESADAEVARRNDVERELLRERERGRGASEDVLKLRAALDSALERLREAEDARTGMVSRAEVAALLVAFKERGEDAESLDRVAALLELSDAQKRVLGAKKASMGVLGAVVGVPMAIVQGITADDDEDDLLTGTTMNGISSDGVGGSGTVTSAAAVSAAGSSTTAGAATPTPGSALASETEHGSSSGVQKEVSLVEAFVRFINSRINVDDNEYDDAASESEKEKDSVAAAQNAHEAPRQSNGNSVGGEWERIAI